MLVLASVDLRSQLWVSGLVKCWCLRQLNCAHSSGFRSLQFVTSAAICDDIVSRAVQMASWKAVMHVKCCSWCVVTANCGFRCFRVRSIL